MLTNTIARASSALTLLKVRFVRSALVLSLGVLVSQSASSDEVGVTIYFVTNPPIACANMEERFCVGAWLAVKAAEEAGLPYRMMELPWNRALREIDADPNAVFVATGRVPSNEDSFNWVVPIYSDQTWVLQHGDSVRRPEDLLNIGVRMGSPFAGEARRRGWSYDEISNWPSIAETLTARRLDGVYATRLGITTHILPRLPKDLAVKVTIVDTMTWWIIRGRSYDETPAMKKFRDAARRIGDSRPYQEKLNNGLWAMADRGG